MPKQCSDTECQNNVFSRGYCMFHWRMNIGAKIIKKSPIKPKKASISPISKSRYEALKKYRRLRDKYFEEHPICEFPDCNSKNITLHHKRGRIGSFLTDKRHFCSLCVKHHIWVNEHNDEALKMGLVHSRLHD